MIIKSREERIVQDVQEPEIDANKLYEDFLVSYFGRSIERLKAEAAALETAES